MKDPTRPPGRHLSAVLLFAVLLLFFLQLISEFIEAIYAFGLLGTSMPVEMAAVLLLFSPLLLLLLPRGLARWALVLLTELVLVARVVTPLLDTRGRMFAAGLGVAGFLVLMPSLLTSPRQDGEESVGLCSGLGLTLALALSICFRALGSGSDISSYRMYQIIGWLLAALAGLLALLWLKPAGHAQTGLRVRTAQDPPSFWRTLALSVGLVSVLLLCYFTLSSPNVIARWTGANYVVILAVVAGSLSLFALLLATEPRSLVALTPGVVLAWNAVFVAAMVLTILAHQISFPSDPGSYPFVEPSVQAWQRIPLYAMLVLSPILVIDLSLFAQELASKKPGSRQLGGAFGLSSLLVLLLVFGHIFTSVYDYIPVVGPLFRDRFWLVHLAAGMTVAFPLLGVSRASLASLHDGTRFKLGRLLPAAIAVLGLLAVAGALLSAPRPAAPVEASTLRIMTYNIQQGYSQDGQRNYDGQLALIREQDPDILGLQECDTNRIANGNADLVRYLADRLDMYSYYGPKVVPGTFGVALLSKYPLQNVQTTYHFSEREQEATVEAQIVVGERSFDLYVTHLASEDDAENLAQTRELLGMVQGMENAIVIGDFNFRPDTEQYRITTELLKDVWLLRWPGGITDQGIDPARRIDHIFVSPGMRVLDSQYLTGQQSDHPALTATIEW
jgi:endonuclease/exonuclease/phosphatase family metal-dependent hydrolase